jgi:16S rRNA (cytidine1402-2'-O)-methyltransferase
MLYVVPTPIGNLADITYRAVETLKNVDYILAEDTRVSKKLLNHYGIDVKLVSYHAHNEHSATSRHITELEEGKNIAIISDAGTPGISDPGFLLIREAVQKELAITVLPGPAAMIPAVVASGIPCDRFYYEGFLPPKKGRQTRLVFLASLDQTFILYASPHKIVKTLGQLIEHCGADRTACVAREISKLHEEITTDTLENLHKHYTEKGKVKGEIVVVVAGKEK